MSDHPTGDEGHEMTFLEWLNYWGPDNVDDFENHDKIMPPQFRAAWPAGPGKRRRHLRRLRQGEDQPNPDGPAVA